MIKRILIILIFSTVLIGGLFAYKFYQIQIAVSSIKPPPPAVVAVAKVKTELWDTSIDAVGSLTAVAGVAISNELAGKVKSISFDSGQTVKMGEVLVELDSETDKAELQGLIAEQHHAELRFARSEKMLDKKFISLSDYDQNQASLDLAKAAVAAKKLIIEKKRIKAPFTGELGIRQVDLGQFLPPGSAVVSLQKLDPIYVDFTIPERHVSHVAINQQVAIQIQAYPNQVYNGAITAISPNIEQNSRSIKIRASLDNPNKQLRPGMFAQIKIVANHPVQVLTIPDTAISFNPYGNSVFLVSQSAQAYQVQVRQVRTGQSRQGRVEILDGLNQDDLVVSAGQLKLRNNMPVTLDQNPAPGERI